MVGGRARRVKAALAFAVLMATGCGQRTDRRLALVHVQLLTELARKGADLVASSRLTAESMPELTYPLERAQAFAARPRDPRPPWLDPFERLVARYRDFVDALDRVRREQSGEAARAALAAPLGAVEAAGGAVREALRAEGGPADSVRRSSGAAPVAGPAPAWYSTRNRPPRPLPTLS